MPVLQDEYLCGIEKVGIHSYRYCPKEADDGKMFCDDSKLLKHLSGLEDEMNSYFHRLHHEREGEK